MILKIFFIVVDFEHVDPQCDTSDEDFELLGWYFIINKIYDINNVYITSKNEMVHFVHKIQPFIQYLTSTISVLKVE